MEEQLPFLLDLRSFLLDRWSDLGLPGTSSGSGLAYRIRHISRGNLADKDQLVALWFRENPEEVQVVTKWRPDKALAQVTLQEYHHAAELHETFKGRFIPKPFACAEIRNTPVLIEEAIPGRSLAHQMMGFGQEIVTPALFQKALDILTPLQHGLRSASKKEVLAFLEPAIRFTQKALPQRIEKSGSLQEILAKATPDPIPGSGQTLLIGNFSPANIIEGPKGIYLLDLSGSEKSPLAFLDTLSFVYGLFELGTKEYSDCLDPKVAATLFRERFLTPNSSLKEQCLRFLMSRKLSKENLPWYWLVFFVYNFYKLGARRPSPNDEKNKTLSLLEAHIADFTVYPQFFQLTSSKSLV